MLHSNLAQLHMHCHPIALGNKNTHSIRYHPNMYSLHKTLLYMGLVSAVLVWS